MTEETRTPTTDDTQTRRVKPLQVGDLSIWPPVIQAPMCSLTGAATRAMAESHGCGVAFTEFVPTEWLIARNRRALERLVRPCSKTPFAVQLYGRDPERMRVAAAMLAADGVDWIDINMGCPRKRVTRKQAGGALMRDPELAASLVRAVCAEAASRAVVTVKIRAGWDAANENAPDFAQKMVAAGAMAVIVHGRTCAQQFSGRADLDVVARVKRAVDVPVIANGDIDDCGRLAEAFDSVGADGAMIGRPAIGNPWIFDLFRSWCEGAPPPLAPSEEERIATYLRHLREHSSYCNDTKRAVIEMRKFARYYLRGTTRGPHLLEAINQLSSPTEIESLFRCHDSGDKPIRACMNSA